MSLISENHIGFKAKNRTADHLFSLKTIIDQYKIKKKKVFAAFIDLRKAFDTIWRVGLFYKLLKSHICQKNYLIIYYPCMQILLPEYNFQTVLAWHLLQNVESNKGMF